jgi:transcriptional regulator with XRE-family HTH domain
MNIRIHRIHAKISQTDLGQKLGVTFQQIQKYEKGTNRVGAGRLQMIANVLNVPVSTFFEGIKTPGSLRAPAQLLGKRDAIKLLEAFEKVEEARVRQSIVSLVQSLSKD